MIGSTANVYFVTLSERLAKDTGNPDLAITPGLWLKKGASDTYYINHIQYCHVAVF